MSYFEKRENVDLYKELMNGYDNNYVLNELYKVLDDNSSLLELGMGTGLDLLALSKKYKVVGSDSSAIFVEDFKNENSLEVCVLNAVSVDIDKKFDCIYSNKVLQHLAKEDFITSLKNQAEHLNKNGILFFTLWNGEHRQEFEFDGELRFVYYNKETLLNIIPEQLTINSVIYYKEFEENDSMIIICSIT